MANDANIISKFKVLILHFAAFGCNFYYRAQIGNLKPSHTEKTLGVDKSAIW